MGKLSEKTRERLKGVSVATICTALLAAATRRSGRATWWWAKAWW